MFIIRTLNVAHRGASSLAPENTIASFDRAVEIGADGIEFDVQLSKDNVPVVIHDENLERTTSGRGPVKDCTLFKLKSLDAGSWFASRFEGEKIPVLDEVLDRYKADNLLFNIELKNSETAYPGLEEAVLKLIEKHKFEGRVIISSFNHDSLVTCRKHNPAIRTGLIYDQEIKEPWHYARSLGCYSVHPLFFFLQSEETISEFKSHNLPLFPWIVNDPYQMEFFVSQDIEAIITDYPRELKKIIAGSREK